MFFFFGWGGFGCVFGCVYLCLGVCVCVSGVINSASTNTDCVSADHRVTCIKCISGFTANLTHLYTHVCLRHVSGNVPILSRCLM